MQLLYTKSRDITLKPKDLLKSYETAIHQSYELYLFNLLQLVKVAQHAVKDATRRTAKLLPTDADKLFTAKLYENEVTQILVENEALNSAIKKYKLDGRVDVDNYRIFYSEFAKTDEYKAYLDKSNLSAQDNIKILLSLYKSCINNELFVELMEDNYPNWVDDKSLVVGLLNKVLHENEELLSIIEPTLKNWDADRVAIIDMILLKMAISELMIFPTIPTKVTLNEFVEIAKQYSTEKSKDFINGVLDRLMKKLQKQGKIKKEGRGLIK